MLLGILSKGVPPGSPNPDPISDQKMSFSTPVFRPGSGCSNAIQRINYVLTFNTIQLAVSAIHRCPVPGRPISTNPGLQFCSFLVFYLPMYCLG